MTRRAKADRKERMKKRREELERLRVAGITEAAPDDGCTLGEKLCDRMRRQKQRETELAEARARHEASERNRRMLMRDAGAIIEGEEEDLAYFERLKNGGDPPAPAPEPDL